jgi:TonB family protein
MMPWISDLSLQLVAQLADVSIRSLCIAFIAFAVIRSARMRSAAARHAIWSVVLGTMLVLPVLAPLVPPMAVKIAPRVFLAASASQPGGSLTHMRSSAGNRTVTQTPPTPAPPRWPALLAALYLTAALGFLARLLVGFRLSSTLLLQSETVRDPRALLLLEELAAAHSIPWPLPRLCASRAAAVPVTVGATDPAILLPGDWQTWDDWKLRAVLAHELAHVRRGDWLVTVAASVNRCIFWFHPLAWWLERRLSALAEDACDEAALLSTGDAPRYASTILEFAAALQATGGRLAQPGVAMARSSQVSRRIDRILETRQLAPGILRKSSWAAVLACALPLVYSAAALQVSPRPDERTPNPGLAQLLTDGSKLSATEAQQIEQQLVRDPEDIATRAKLISYYSWHAIAHPRLEHIFWLIEHHPESEIAAYYSKQHLSADRSPGQSQLDYEHAKTLWLQQVAAHPTDARVLGNAAYFIGEKDQFAQEDLFKRARGVDPSNPEWAQRLAFVFARAIALSFWAPVVPPVDPSFAVAAKAELETSTDAALVGTTGELLAGGAPAGSPPRPAQIDYAEHLLNRAQSLDASNLEWSSALTRLRAARENPPAPPPASGIQRIRVGAAVQQSNLLHQVDPVYPPLARQARIQGVVRFNVIVAQDGHISNITLINGHPLLVPAAQEAVKQWVYRPTLLNGDPVEVATVIDVNFMLPHEN